MQLPKIAFEALKGLPEEKLKEVAAIIRKLVKKGYEFDIMSDSVILIRKNDSYPWYRWNLIDEHQSLNTLLKRYEEDVESIFDYLKDWNKEITSRGIPYKVIFEKGNLEIRISFSEGRGIQIRIFKDHIFLTYLYTVSSPIYSSILPKLIQELSKIEKKITKQEKISDKITKEYSSIIEENRNQLTSYITKPLYHFTSHPTNLLEVIQNESQLKRHQELKIRGLSTTWTPLPPKDFSEAKFQIVFIPTSPLKVFELNPENYRLLRDSIPKKLSVPFLIENIEDALKAQEYDAFHISPGSFEAEEKEIVLLNFNKVKIKEINGGDPALKSRFSKKYPDLFLQTEKLSSKLSKIAKTIFSYFS